MAIAIERVKSKRISLRKEVLSCRNMVCSHIYTNLMVNVVSI